MLSINQQIKKCFALLAIILYLVAMAQPVIPVFEYLLNKDYIAEFLCINKDKPTLNCNGKCYLNKKLAAHSKSKSNSDNETIPRIEIEKYPISLICQDAGHSLKIEKTNKEFVLIELLLEDQYLHSVFRPPQNVVLLI